MPMKCIYIFFSVIDRYLGKYQSTLVFVMFKVESLGTTLAGMLPAVLVLIVKGWGPDNEISSHLGYKVMQQQQSHWPDKVIHLFSLMSWKYCNFPWNGHVTLQPLDSTSWHCCHSGRQGLLSVTGWRWSWRQSMLATRRKWGCGWMPCSLTWMPRSRTPWSRPGWKVRPENSPLTVTWLWLVLLDGYLSYFYHPHLYGVSLSFCSLL